MEIKTSLKQLVTYFANSAASAELSVPVRRFAAQLIILTTHLQRVEGTAKRVTDDLDARLATIEGLLVAAQAGTPGAEGAAPGATAPGQEQPSGEMSEDEEAEAMALKAQAEVDADLAEMAKGEPEPAVVVVQTPRKNGGKKATQPGDAA